MTPVRPSSSPIEADDEVGVGVGHPVGAAVAEAAAEQAAPAHPEQRLDGLEAAAELVVVVADIGCSHTSTRLRDVADRTGRPTNAPTTNSTPPTTSQPGRSVAT